MPGDVTAYFDEFHQAFRVADALDIAVIAVLLYAALIWFKQTASRSVFVGVFVVTALYFAALTFDMYLTSLVFHTAFAVFLVVLVVLFQEEIRRAFERIANWGTLRELRPKSTALVEEVDALVEATFALASQRTGALIVLSGREPLDRHVDGGIVLNGSISKPILYSIFDPGSAGHDGAAIIRRNRIERFGTHLRISKNHREIGGRGTRHSAALGLAECSDSMTIVVSEERGVVSIAEKGRLTTTATAAELKSRIEQFHERRFPQKTEATWKRFISHDIRGKLLALSLAILAWFSLAFSVERVQTSVVVPIEYRNLPEHAQVDDATPVDALMTLSGTERAFRLLDRRVLKISLDLSSVDEGTETITITADDVRLPPNLKVDRIQPSEIRVVLEQPVDQRPPDRSPRVEDPD